MYYPEDRKYVELDIDMPNHLPPRHVKTPVKSEEWKLSITLSWVVLLHMCVLYASFLAECATPQPTRVRRNVYILSAWSQCFRRYIQRRSVSG